MATTVVTVEFGTNHHYYSQEENFEACLCSSLNRYKQMTRHCVNYDILIKKNHVLDCNMNTNQPHPY